MHQIAPSETSI